MEFTLKRQSLEKEMIKIISRQKTKKDLDLHKLSRKNLKEIKSILSEIQDFSIPKKYVLKKLKGKIGHGIFLHPETKPMLKGEVIAPYAGEVSLVPQNQVDDADYAFDPVTDLKLTKEEQKLFDPKNKYHPRRLYVLMLDAARRGNFTRFINHSTKPNVVAYLASSPGHPYEIVYMAKKKIMPGEQLLVCYEDGENSYWAPLGIKPFPMDPKTFRLDKSLKIITKK